MNKKNTIITAAVVAVIAVAAIATAAMNKSDDSNTAMTNNMSMQDSMNMDQPLIQKSQDGVQETNMVTYKGFAVVQKTIKIKKGTTVTWTNEDNAKHDVTFAEDYPGLMSTELFGKGETKSIKFDTVGTYSYFCSPHPYMKGMIEVTE